MSSALVQIFPMPPLKFPQMFPVIPFYFIFEIKCILETQFALKSSIDINFKWNNIIIVIILGFNSEIKQQKI